MKTSLELLDWPLLCQLLATYAESPLGKELLLRLRPFRSLADLEDCASAVAEGIGLLEGEPLLLLREVSDLMPLLQAMRNRGSGLSGQELHVVACTLAAAERLRESLGERDQWPNLRARVRRLPMLKPLLKLLSRSVDSDGSILDSADPELASLRESIQHKDREVRWLAERIAQRPSWRSILRGGPPVLRDGRFMLAVRAECRGQIPGVFHDRSSSGASIFVEPSELVEPQNQLMDLRAAERKAVGAVLLSLSRDVLKQEGEIHESMRLLGRIDAVLARSRFARESGARLAQVVERGVLRLKAARHPLLLARERGTAAGRDGWRMGELAVVPFDLSLGDEFDALIVTGPNTGGKTATLKAVGLVAVMALCAVPVPVDEGAEIPWFDEVFADVGDEQDIQQNLSTFSGHLRHLVQILDQATSASLVLLDELGCGTDPKEGEALGAALICDWLRRGARVIATTHLSGLKDLAINVPRVQNASLEFDPSSLRPLYRLTIGLPGDSNALLIARRLGVPEPILEDAKGRLVGGLGAEWVRVTEQVQKSRAAVQRHLERAEEERRLLEKRWDSQAASERELKTRSETLELQKQTEIDRVLREAESEGLALLADLGSLPAGFEAKVEALRSFLRGMSRRSDLSRRRAACVLSRKRDDLVFLPRYRESCRVRKVDRERRQLTVLYRAMSLEVPFDEVECPVDFVESTPH